MAAMIAVRILGGGLFDRTNKRKLLMTVLALLVLFFVMIPRAGSPVAFYLLACLYGLCIGVALPLINALLFSASPPLLRGLNTNLTLFALDAAYFLMPYLGGLLIAFGMGFDILFYAGAGFVFLSLTLVLSLARQEKANP